MEFVYLVVSYPADSAYPFTNHVSDKAPTHIYAIYSNMSQAAGVVADIYARQILGVKHGTEYAVIKHKVEPAQGMFLRDAHDRVILSKKGASE